MAKQRADAALVQRRIDDVLRMRLEGAQFWDVRESVREAEQEEGSAWLLAEGETPLSDGQIRRYQSRADALMVEHFERNRKKLLPRHVARLIYLYGRATTAGELSTARAILRDLAEMQRLLPRPEDQLQKEVAELKRMLAEVEQANDGGGNQERAGADPAADRGAEETGEGAGG